MAQELKKVTVFEEDSGLGHITMNTTEELKVGEFKPEFVGKMQFYLAALDDQERMQDERPSIGMILCRTKDRAIVEYALRESKKPIGVASYQIVKRLPKALANELPEPKEIEKLLMDLNDERKKIL